MCTAVLARMTEVPALAVQGTARMWCALDYFAKKIATPSEWLRGIRNPVLAGAFGTVSAPGFPPIAPAAAAAAAILALLVAAPVAVVPGRRFATILPSLLSRQPAHDTSRQLQ